MRRTAFPGHCLGCSWKVVSQSSNYYREGYIIYLHCYCWYCFSVTKSCSILCDPRTAAHQDSLSFTVSYSSLKFISIESLMLSNHLTLCHPLLLLPSASGSFSMSQFFTSGGQSIGASASIFPNEYSGLFRIDWFDLLVVQGTLNNLLQNHKLKASVLHCSAFIIVQFSHLYMTTGKTIALTIRTFVRKLTSLLFNMLSRFVIAFLPRSKCLLVSWL